MTNIEFHAGPIIELVQHVGDDQGIAEAAWVSNYGRDVPDDRAVRIPGLINFLMRDRHGTPFEHNSMTFRVSAPLFVFYEWHRHRAGWSFNEESARYRELAPVFYVPSARRKLTQIGKPGAYQFEHGTVAQYTYVESAHRAAARQSWTLYQGMLTRGIAREVARNVLPTSIFKTQYATCNLRSLFHFLSLRWAHELSKVPTFPLYEIEQVARGMEKAIRGYFPLAFDAFDKNGRIAP